MNDYMLYKLKIKSENLFYDTLGVIFYVPSMIYKNNQTFKEMADRRENRKYQKRKYKQCMDRIFYYLDRNKDGLCSVALFRDIYDGVVSDICDSYDFNFMLKDDSWAKRNKLNYEKMTYKEYIEKYHPNLSYMFDGYVWDKYKDDTIVVIHR